MFGFFLNKKNVFSYSFLSLLFIVSFIFLSFYLKINLISVLLIGFLAILHYSFFNLSNNDNNDLYKEFIFGILFLTSINPKITLNQSVVIFVLGILWYLVCLKNTRTIGFYFTLGLLVGFSLIGDFLFSFVVLGLFFGLNFALFNLVKAINFIFGCLTSLCLLWISLFLLNQTENWSNFFILDFGHILLKKDLSTILFKLVVFIPFLLIIIFVISYYLNRRFTLKETEFKKIKITISIVISILVGIIITGNSNYFNFLFCFPIAYLIGNYFSLSKSENHHTLIRETMLLFMVLSSVLVFLSEHFSFLDEVKSHFYF